MREKLTIRQQELLVLAAEPAFRIQGFSICGPREYRTAKSLERKGFTSISVTHRMRLTPAGRAALGEEQK